ncbi:MAG TPA: DUF4386 domain-containing protein [Gemmatimonadaceae bacterium]|nr:DUF4386 domain-containing protein [Gemmatimonadaceae bacterium]
MSLSSADSPQTTARLAGALWLIVIAVSIASLFAAPSVNINGSPAETAASILAAETPYRLAFALLFVGSLCYLGVTALLYELLRPVNRSVALFGAFAGLAGLTIGAASAVNELGALDLLKQASTAAPAAASQLQTIAQFALRDGPEFKVGMVFFGLQIASVGYLILRSGLVPRIIGGVLVAGGLSYIITSFATFVAPAVGARLSPMVIPIAILGEGSLTLWLLFKGVSAPARETAS